MVKTVKRDPNAPKRNQTAYILYQNAMRETFKSDNPEMDFGKLAKYTSVKYAEMDEVERDDWNQREEADKARYLHELSEYIPPPGFDKNGDSIKPTKPPKPKKTKGGKIRDPNAPKKSVSAYIMYQNAMRSSFQSDNPGMSFGKLAKYTSSMYKSLSTEERNKWESDARKDKERYDREMESYEPPEGYNASGYLNPKSTMVKDPKAPKRARGPYVYFTMDERPKLKDENPDLKFTEIGHALGERWRALSAEDKKKYEEKANDDKKRHSDELAVYNANKPKPSKAKANSLSTDVHPGYDNPFDEEKLEQCAEGAVQHVNAEAYARYYATHHTTSPSPPETGQAEYLV